MEEAQQLQGYWLGRVCTDHTDKLSVGLKVLVQVSSCVLCVSCVLCLAQLLLCLLSFLSCCSAVAVATSLSSLSSSSSAAVSLPLFFCFIISAIFFFFEATYSVLAVYVLQFDEPPAKLCELGLGDSAGPRAVTYVATVETPKVEEYQVL